MELYPTVSLKEFAKIIVHEGILKALRPDEYEHNYYNTPTALLTPDQIRNHERIENNLKKYDEWYPKYASKHRQYFLKNVLLSPRSPQIYCLIAELNNSVGNVIPDFFNNLIVEPSKFAELYEEKAPGIKGLFGKKVDKFKYKEGYRLAFTPELKASIENLKKEIANTLSIIDFHIADIEISIYDPEPTNYKRTDRSIWWWNETPIDLSQYKNKQWIMYLKAEENKSLDEHSSIESKKLRFDALVEAIENGTI